MPVTSNGDSVSDVYLSCCIHYRMFQPSRAVPL